MTRSRSLATTLLAAALLATAARADDPVTLKVLTFNIWYGGDQVSFAKVIEAIRLADADIVGLQEPDGKTLQIAALAGYPYADVRRHILSKFPLFDSGLGETTRAEPPPYSIAGVDPDTVHAWAMVSPGKVVAIANTHLTSNPYGPELIRDGATADQAVATEIELRLPEAEALMNDLKPLADAGVPVILTGDFNAASHLDWTLAAMATRPQVKFPVKWPVSALIEASGFADSFRTAHPDEAATPGLTWTAGMPFPIIPEGETLDRIDYIFAANATVINSVLVGEAGNPTVSLSVAPWPSDHRAVLTTLQLTPADAPALIGVEPSPVVAGQGFLIRVNTPNRTNWTAVVVPRGAGPDAALTGIADIDPADRPTIRLSTIGIAPGAYDAILLAPDGAEQARTRFSVIPENAKATLTLTSATVRPGADIALDFSGAPGFRFDWVGIYHAGEPSVYNYLGFAYTGARHQGSLRFPADVLYEELTPGAYEARLMFDDHYETLAIAPFTVTAP